MKGKIEITAEQLTEETNMTVKVQMENVSITDKYQIFKAMCEGLETSLEEMLLTKKFVSIFDKMEDKK